MTLKDVKRVVGSTPNMTLARASDLRRLLRTYELGDVLELGFSHGVGTCYLASIVQELGHGRVTSIDLVATQDRQPNIHELLERCRLANLVDIYFEPTSYTWRLMKFLEADPQPQFDFCYLDAAHSWFVDALGFFLVDLLLRPGGWIVFDDLDWTFGSSSTIARADWVLAMPEEERYTPQVDRIYELLVKTHPQYVEFRREGNWAYARKGIDVGRSEPQPRIEYVLERPGHLAQRLGASMAQRLRRRRTAVGSTNVSQGP